MAYMAFLGAQRALEFQYVDVVSSLFRTVR